jgi:hypothetical protein
MSGLLKPKSDQDTHQPLVAQEKLSRLAGKASPSSTVYSTTA